MSISEICYSKLSFRRFAIFLTAAVCICWSVSSVVHAGAAVSISAPANAFTNEVVLVDARQSVGVSRMLQADGSPSITIDFGDGFSANLMASGHAYRAPGTYTITVTAKDSNGASSIEHKSIVVSSIPTASGTNLQILTDTGNAAANGVMLQNAINFAAQNNSVEQEIILPPGVTFAGPIVLSLPTGSKYITIRGASLSTAGNRVGLSEATSMPVITSPS